jgi:hypothetical protein
MLAAPLTLIPHAMPAEFPCAAPRAPQRCAPSCRRQTGSPFCFRRLLSNADAGTKRRRKLTWRAIFPAA